MLALDEELAHRGLGSASDIVCDSSAMFEGAQKLGLGSSAAVTVAATALALGSVDDRARVFDIASAAHLRAQGGVGSGADVAASVYGGAISYTFQRVVPLGWPRGVTLVPFFTGAAANTRELVAEVKQARAARQSAVDAALHAIAMASIAAGSACAQHSAEIGATGVLAALALAARATDQLAAATGVALVPPSVHAVRAVAARLGGTAKTTGAGGGDVAIAVIPATEDVTVLRRSIIESSCVPLELKLDQAGVDLRPDVQ
ncbi:MAG: hypothetical protein ACM31C_23470 [Acidobacteriota bacterium]